jgi:hypothetical protein
VRKPEREPPIGRKSTKTQLAETQNTLPKAPNSQARPLRLDNTARTTRYRDLVRVQTPQPEFWSPRCRKQHKMGTHTRYLLTPETRSPKPRTRQLTLCASKTRPKLHTTEVWCEFRPHSPSARHAERSQNSPPTRRQRAPKIEITPDETALDSWECPQNNQIEQIRGQKGHQDPQPAQPQGEPNKSTVGEACQRSHSRSPNQAGIVLVRLEPDPNAT